MLLNGERQVAPELSGIRRDHVARYEFVAARLPKGSRVLDLACGVGYGAYILAKAGHYVRAVDANSEAIQYGLKHYWHERLVYVCEAAERESIGRDVNYDAILSFETLEHLADPAPLLKTWAGWAPLLFASVPNETVFPHGGRIKFHHRHYTRSQFGALLTDAGWQVGEWHGQAGPTSEVEPKIEGRTLIAVGHSKAFATTKGASVKPVPRHVTIIGLGPSITSFVELTKRMGGRRAYCDEVWGINCVGDVLACDLVFHMDDLKVQEARAAARPGSNIDAMVKWLKTYPGPVMTSRVREGYPGLIEFPLQAVLNGGYDSNGGAPYFNSTAAYAVAYAIHLGVEKVSLFGIDYTLPNVHTAERGRACVEFWLGIAAARGIEIALPEQTTLLDACAPEAERLYGYDCVDVLLKDRPDGKVDVEFHERETAPDAAEIERRYDHKQHPNRLMQEQD